MAAKESDASLADPSASSISQKRPPSLLDFSNEILISIIQYVNSGSHDSDGDYVMPRGSRNLLALALCSRHIYELAEPVLYSAFRQSGNQALPSFLCRILERSDLARRVKLFYGASIPDYLDMSGLKDQDWSRIRKACREAFSPNLGIEFVEIWTSAIGYGSPDATTALVLCLTPNLEELQFRDYAIGYEFIHLFVDRAAEFQIRSELSSFSLPNLKSVSLDFWDTEYGMPFSDLEPFLKLKSVTKFEADGVCEDTVSADEDVKDKGLIFSTTDLTLTRCVLAHGDMVAIFRCFPNLERLYYEHGGPTVGGPDFQPPYMLAAIEHLKPCLKDLTILFEYMFAGYEYEEYPIGSLAQFEKLTSIDVTASILLGDHGVDNEDGSYDGEDDKGFPRRQRLVDAVPPTLQRLSLRDISRADINEIFRLVAQKPKSAPSLQTLDLRWEGIHYPDKPSPTFPTSHPSFTEQQAARLLSECEKAGVELLIRYLPPKPKYCTWMENLVELTDGRTGVAPITETFAYPYDGFEEFCREKGCDPVTGQSEIFWRF